MPVHDWTRVTAGTFHDFHNSWIVTLKAALNDGLLPTGYYALTEQVARDFIPDVLTLRAASEPTPGAGRSSAGILAVAETPPKVALMSNGDDIDEYASRQRTLVIRHSTDDEVVALIELASQGNKQTHLQLTKFVEKAVAVVLQGVHLLVIDLYPPGRNDPQGIHGAIWREFKSIPFELPRDKPLVLSAYEASSPPRAYVEPTCVGMTLPDMPLFIQEGGYINIPLERTYIEAYATVPERWRRVIEGRDG